MFCLFVGRLNRPKVDAQDDDWRGGGDGLADGADPRLSKAEAHTGQPYTQTNSYNSFNQT
ncbi:hypothetical protein HanOQP8_Chr11g0416041 [Helianthus annuus]|nr:hypothetical protein HanHA89_Chr11g0437291 [Helianthus annuus]KAJ0686456.1 hypothetical protein HanLR1_Chr11g0414971 [Helianthus annuus]KAJ0690276.1 hypothetical protein HanOQP8_Chr11g0416041 [Helianthus annuus]